MKTVSWKMIVSFGLKNHDAQNAENLEVLSIQYE